MEKNKFYVILFGVVFVIAIFLFPLVKMGNKIEVAEKDGFVGSLNVPDRCEIFTQIASRGSKGRIKAAPGKIFSFSVTSSASQGTYFQLYDRSNLTVKGNTFATPSFSIPVPVRPGAENSARVDYDFVAPLSMTASGIYFAISNNYANYSSTSFTLRANDFTVEDCYN